MLEVAELHPNAEVSVKVYAPAPRFGTLTGKPETLIEPVAAPVQLNVPVPLPVIDTEPVFVEHALGFVELATVIDGVGLTVTEIALLAVLIQPDALINWQV